MIINETGDFRCEGNIYNQESSDFDLNHVALQPQVEHNDLIVKSWGQRGVTIESVNATLEVKIGPANIVLIFSIRRNGRPRHSTRRTFIVLFVSTFLRRSRAAVRKPSLYPQRLTSSFSRFGPRSGSIRLSFTPLSGDLINNIPGAKKSPFESNWSLYNFNSSRRRAVSCSARSRSSIAWHNRLKYSSARRPEESAPLDSVSRRSKVTTRRALISRTSSSRAMRRAGRWLVDPSVVACERWQIEREHAKGRTQEIFKERCISQSG
ncbi:hypothetical protein K503DRAFT_772623 [Rhizopogon vinicolor AM-OR11-026]|uniref:Uncharacterized protein n=1 Tax=Rhizopogon vinicolor AM-OR11-026 TaxID=1314800 RepID=A0A1B7MUM5_9AGAM|nr:hypothetical protein K503DRAFT_772623 [Rhizopogon vinicolor AM-OR11-026]